jgi:hypothetical protein
MAYFIVPNNAVNDTHILDIDYLDLIEGFVGSDASIGYAKIKDSIRARESWREITEEQYNQAKESM